MLRIISILFISFALSITRSDIYDDSWALLVGINEYETVTPNLNYAVDDAEDFKELLIAQFGFSENKITILKNQEATKYNIEKELGKLRRKTKENDRVLIFFAVHGQTYELPEGGEMGFLLPYDSDIEDLYLSSIPMTDLKQQANTFKAKHVLFMVDACYGGLAATGARGISSSAGDLWRNVPDHILGGVLFYWAAYSSWWNRCNCSSGSFWCLGGTFSYRH